MGLFDRLLGRGGPTSRVRMVNSVGVHAAGEQYDLPVDLADRYIARTYAEGALSRVYEADELQELLGNPQVVKL